jgi:hypothetical protein
LVAFVELDVEIRGTEISANSCVLADVVAPAAEPTAVLTVDKKTLNVVATEFTAAADATVLNLTLCTKLPCAPEANAEYIKIIPVAVDDPSEDTTADVVAIFVVPTLGVKLKIGDVFAGISYKL